MLHNNVNSGIHQLSNSFRGKLFNRQLFHFERLNTISTSIKIQKVI